MADNIETLKEIADNCGGRLMKDYSGRGMYGKKCVGIDCHDSTEVIEAAAEQNIRGAKIDNLGRGFIVYWPSIQVS